MLWCPLRFPHENDIRLVFTSCYFWRDHVLFTLFVFVCVWWCPTHIVLRFCFVFLRLVCSLLPVSLNCPFLIGPSLFSNVYSYNQAITPRVLIKMIKTQPYTIIIRTTLRCPHRVFMFHSHVSQPLSLFCFYLSIKCFIAWLLTFYSWRQSHGSSLYLNCMSEGHDEYHANCI